jgi:hypothetical protein
VESDGVVGIETVLGSSSCGARVSAPAQTSRGPTQLPLQWVRFVTLYAHRLSFFQMHPASMLLHFQCNYPIFLCNAILGETEKGEGIFIGQLVSLGGNWLGFYRAVDQWEAFTSW